MKIKNIFSEFEVGEVITVFLKNGMKEEGILISSDENSIKIKTLTKTFTIFEDIICGWVKYDLNKIGETEKVINHIDNLIVQNDNEQEISTIDHGVESLSFVNTVESKIIKEILSIPNFENNDNIDVITPEKNEEIKSEFLPFEIEDIPWKEDGLPDEDMFKGRDELLHDLVRHYRSPERKKTFVLYGLTRTGKSSVLRYFFDEILNQDIKIDRTYKFIPFIWDLSRAAAQSNAKDMWNYLLHNSTAVKIDTFRSKGLVTLPDKNDLLNLKEYRLKHLNEFITYLKSNGYFPIFLIDEFTYYIDLAKSGKVDPSFIANFRQLSYSNLASFVYAGTYNLRRLVSDPSLSITGQFTNTIEIAIGQIDVEPAIELTMAFSDKVSFNEESIAQILLLSNRIPYFIQIICKNAAFYCFENNTNSIDAIKLEEVVKILVGDKPKNKGSRIQKISEGAFGNNQFDPTDKNGMVLLSSLCFLNADNKHTNGVGYSEIANLWAENGLKNPNQILQAAMEDLLEKGILIKNNNKGTPVYKIGVQLFSRWWNNEKSNDIKMEVSKLLIN